jgi:hypothetical protein
MRRMDDQTVTPDTAVNDAPPEAEGRGALPDPGERRLDRPPSDRYRTDAAPTAPAAGSATSPARGIAFAVIVAIGVSLAITVLGGIFLVSAGLVVVAAAGGWAVAIALRLGAGATLPRPGRAWLAGGLALAAILLGQVGLWLLARSQGGVLPIADHLSQTYGPLVPLQAIAAMAAAGWTAR